jgi:hypothetical protein
VNDEKMQIWKSFERRSWPSQVVVSPKSQMPILILHGEGMRQVLDLFISVAYDFYYDSLNHQKTYKIRVEDFPKKKPALPELKAAKTQNLKFPGKVICIEK